MSDQQVPSSIINLEEVSDSGRPFLKTGAYSVRCIAVEKGKSRKGNDMLTMTYEIVAPESVMVKQKDNNEKEQKITGLKVTDWVTFNDFGFAKLKTIHKALNLPLVFDKKNPNMKVYLGKAFKVSLSTDPQVLKDDNTGEPLQDETGAPQTINTYKIQRFTSADTEFTLPSDSVAF